jgi:hypothetical protein
MTSPFKKLKKATYFIVVPEFFEAGYSSGGKTNREISLGKQLILE